MMPLGSHSVGGRSSSTSNLSPLAPPFTFDKPYQKQPSSNPPLNFAEPTYSPHFDRPRPVWPPSNFVENSSRNGKFPSEVHGLPISQPNNSSQSDPLTPLKSEASDGYDWFPHGRYTDSVRTGLVDTKSYFPPYVAVGDRESVAGNEPSYDLLSNFSAGKLSGSSQVDDARMVAGPGAKYDPRWSGLWNSMSNEEQRKALGLGPKDYKPSGSSTGQKCIKKGSLESYVETSVGSKNSFGCFGGETNFGHRSIEDHKSFKELNSGSATGSCIVRPAVGSTSPCNKNRHLQDPFQQAPLPKYFGLYESPLNSQDTHANYTGSYFLDSPSTMRSSPANPGKMTFGGFPSPQDAGLSMAVNSKNSKAIDKIETASDFVPYHPFGLNCQDRTYAGKADSFLTRSSSAKMDDNIKKKHRSDDCFDQLLMTKSVTPNPHLGVSDCFKMNSDTAVTFFSKEISSDGPEIQNTAVDSPCWKGALATRFSLVEDSKLIGPEDIVGKLESRFNFYSEEHKRSPTGLNTTDTINVSQEVIQKNSSYKSSDPNYVSKECEDSCATKQSCHNVELSLLNYSGIASNSKSPRSLQRNSEDHEGAAKDKLAVKLVASVAELKGKSTVPPTSVGLSCAPTNVADHLPHSTSENVMKTLSEVHKSVLLNAMKALSQALVDHCSKRDATSTELDDAAVKHIISNLNCCLVKEADVVTQTEKGLDPQQGTSCCEDALQPQMVRKATTAHTDPHGLDILGVGNHDIFWDSSFLKDDAETVRDDDTVQAIKRVLDMKFPSEELQPETVLYKNLWLEAEAALCATTVQSRFKRLKIEMERREQPQTNDEENLQIPKASDVESSVVPRFRTLGSVVEDLKPPNSEANYKPTIALLGAAPQSNANDSEASVMARLQILKSRADNLESQNTEDENSAPSKKSEPASSNQSSEDSYFASITSHKDDLEASVKSRFNILKSRPEHPFSSLHSDTHQRNEECVEYALGAPGVHPGDEVFAEWEHVLKGAFLKRTYCV